MSRFWRRSLPRLCLVTPTRASHDFFEKVVDEFSTQAEEHDFDFVLKTPKGNYETSPSTLTVKSLIERLSYRDVLVLVPARADATYPVLESYLNGPRPSIVMTFDLAMRLRDRKLPYTKGSDSEGGKLAADAANWYLSDRKVEIPKVLVVKGLWGDERLTAFKEGIRKERSETHLLELPDRCEWDIESARRKVTEFLEARAKNGGGGSEPCLLCQRRDGARCKIGDSLAPPSWDDWCSWYTSHRVRW